MKNPCRMQGFFIKKQIKMCIEKMKKSQDIEVQNQLTKSSEY